MFCQILQADHDGMFLGFSKDRIGGKTSVIDMNRRQLSPRKIPSDGPLHSHFQIGRKTSQNMEITLLKGPILG